MLVCGLTIAPAAAAEPKTASGDRGAAQDAPTKRPHIRKLGTIDCDMVETTPIVFAGKLYRFEYVRERYKPNRTGKSYFRFIDVASGEATQSFAVGYHLGSAFVDRGTVYVYGVEKWGGERIQVFWSKDLKSWSSKAALTLPGWGIYNDSVCKDPNGYVMAFEIGEPPEEAGVRFTTRFAKSKNLLDWKLTPSACVFSKERYTACPAIHFLDGQYYMIYLEARPGPTYEPHIVRSRDLRQWEPSPLNPLMQFSPEDKRIASKKFTPAQREHITKAVNLNNSDVDLCEFQGKVVLYYSWGNQKGIEFLAEARYDGTLPAFLRGFFTAR